MTKYCSRWSNYRSGANIQMFGNTIYNVTGMDVDNKISNLNKIK
jgi:hypothetical protein